MFRPRVVATLQPWAKVSERLRRNGEHLRRNCKRLRRKSSNFQTDALPGPTTPIQELFNHIQESILVLPLTAAVERDVENRFDPDV